MHADAVVAARLAVDDAVAAREPAVRLTGAAGLVAVGVAVIAAFVATDDSIAASKRYA